MDKYKNIKFSPDGKHFALSKDKTVFVYILRHQQRVYDPFSLERVYQCAYDEVLSLDWSHDSRLLSLGSRIYGVNICAFTKFTTSKSWACWKTTLCLEFSLTISLRLCTVSQNGHVNVWDCSAKETDLIPVGNIFKPKVKEETLEEDDAVQPLEEEKTEDSKEKKKNGVLIYKRRFRMYLSQYIKDQKSVVTSVSYMKKNQMLVASFSSGDFLLLDLTETGSLIHSLNISKKSISSTCINSTGDWIALGVASLGELLVWEWQSETHVLKQQGHFNSMRVVSYSPDGLNLATGGEDGKLKIWSTQSSFCFVTFSEHTSAITGVSFTQSGKAILSCSLDGTVRAFDMIRYRNFKTLTSPTPTQFSCLSVDSSGELVVAGGQDNHDIFLWSLQTGKLLEILGGHSGPVVSLQFSMQMGSTKLVSTAWDKTVKVWDAINNTTAKETVTLMAEGMCVSIRMDGEQFAVATMDGHITIFNAGTLRQEGVIEGRGDLGAGREDLDKVTAKTNLKSKYFSTLSYSSDGKHLIAAGQSKNVCIYSVEDEILVKKFEVTQNRSLDAMDKTMSRRLVTRNGLNLAEVETRAEKEGEKVPGTQHGPLSQRSYRPQVRVTSLSVSKTGVSWAACTTEGLLIYSLDDDWLFDPLQLEENNTPEAVRRKLKNKSYSTALMMATRLNMKSLTKEVLERIPHTSVSVVVDSLTQLYVESLIKILPGLLESSPHVGFYSLWVTTLVTKHGQLLKSRAPSIMSELSGLQKALTNHYDNLGKVCSHNEYMLNYLLCQASLKASRISASQPALKALSSSEDEDDIDDEDDDDEEMEEEETEMKDDEAEMRDLSRA
ncbi:UNVERIFIED_CONTAM: hypothetical protein GTU68_053217, partial [Idotea baltica]|nr:hypothetical protein [Idotea baltica]